MLGSPLLKNKKCASRTHKQHTETHSIHVNCLQAVPDSFDLPNALSDLVIKLFALWVCIELGHVLFKVYKCWHIGRCCSKLSLPGYTSVPASQP